MATVICGNCTKTLSCPDEYLGKKMQCPNCHQVFTADIPFARVIPQAPQASDSNVAKTNSQRFLRSVGSVTTPQFPFRHLTPVQWIGVLGRIFWMLGCVSLGWSMLMSTVVAVPGGFGNYDGVHNIGLLNIRQNFVIVGCFFMTNGLICQLFSLAYHAKQSDNR